MSRDSKTGKYSYEGNWDRLCVCGHSLGEYHTAEPPHPCGNNGTGLIDCDCTKFRPAKVVTPDSNIELREQDIIKKRYLPSVFRGQVTSISENIDENGVTYITYKKEELHDYIVALIEQVTLEARIDEARHWSEHILGSPRSVVSNEKAKSRIAQLSPKDHEEEE